MNIYLVSIDEDSVGYDAYDGHVIAATSEQQCRDMCPVGDEGRQAWADAAIKVIGTGEFPHPMVVLSSFNAG